MSTVNVIDLDGNHVSELEVAEEVFSSEIKEHLLWEVVRWQRAKRRAGTAKTKDRSEVNRTGAKMYRQKGTGRARHGSARVNVFRGGGQVHGPTPRSYEFSVNKKARRKALCCALSLRHSAGDLLVLKDLNLAQAKTKELAKVLDRLGASHALLVDLSTNESLSRSAKNLVKAQMLPCEGLNVYDVLRYPKLVISQDALRKVEQRLLGEKVGE